MGFKTTIYGRIPDDWEELKIGDIATKVTDYVANGSFKSLAENVIYKDDEDYAVLIRLTDFNNSYKGNFVYVDKASYDFLKKSKLTAGDIIISNVGANVGTVFKCPNLNKPMTLGPNAITVDFKGCNEFYFQFLKSKTGQQLLKSIVTGSAQPKFNKTNFKELVLPVPPLETQRKIAAILSAIDDKIELNNRMNENLMGQAKSLYNSWFKKYTLNNGIKPLEWETKSIYELSNIIYGAPFSSKMFNTNKNGLPIIRIRDLKNQEFVTYTTEKHPKGYMLKKGDIVVGMDGEFKPYIWGNEQAWLNQRVCVFENKRPFGKFFLYFTISPQLDFIESTEAATTVIHIGKNDFDKFIVEMPDEQTMNKFDELTNSMYQTIVKNHCENKRLTELRDALLPKLMSGEIDVSKVEI